MKATKKTRPVPVGKTCSKFNTSLELYEATPVENIVLTASIRIMILIILSKS